jgi:hypothetical protein
MTNPALAPVADKLGKLLRMLSSNHDGEIIGAARSIVRTLDVAGLTIHELADGLTAANGKKFSEEDALEIYRRGVADGRTAAEAESDGEMFHEVGKPDWAKIARKCEARSDRLQDHEKKFVADMVRWAGTGGELTDKQQNWLRSIYVRKVR